MMLTYHGVIEAVRYFHSVMPDTEELAVVRLIMLQYALRLADERDALRTERKYGALVSCDYRPKR